MSTMNLHSNIVSNYQQKNYTACLNLLTEAPIEAQNAPQYKVLKAACLVHLGRNIKLAHAILDDVLTKETRNSFAYYGKGLAYFSTKKMSQAIRCFDKAIELDTSGSMGRALELKQHAVDIMNEAGYKEDVREDDHESAIERKGREMIEKHFAAQMEAEVVNEVGEMEDIAKNIQVTPTKRIKLSYEEKEKSPKKKKKAKKISVPPAPSLADYDTSKTCKMCSKTFTKRFSLKRHLRLHKSFNGFKCSKCGLTYLHRTELKRHEATHKKTYDYTCGDCGKRFVSKENLKKHRLEHVTTTVDQEFSCQSCEKTFKTEKLQKYHESLHKKEENADKSDTLSDNTKVSLNTKTADKKDCGNYTEFADKMEDADENETFIEATTDKMKDIPDEEENNVKTETAFKKEAKNSTHEEEKPFGCNLCNTSYTSIDCLGKHFISFHGVGK